MTDTLKLRVIGLCILSAFPLFGLGQALLGSDMHQLGLFMCLANSIAVIAIGSIMRPIIATSAPLRGHIYLIARISEGMLLAISTLAASSSFLLGMVISVVCYQLAMIALGLGSLPMCLWLIRTKFAPPALGWLGFVGYICLVLAMMSSVYGAGTASMALLLPGAAFEVAFGLILLLGPQEMRVLRAINHAQ